MARINKTAQDETNDSNLDQAVQQFLPSISITTDPVFICGVNRRTNVGNWEHIDLYAGIALPLANVSLQQREELKEMVIYAAEIGFNMTSSETYNRYNMIKEAQKTPRT